MPETTQDTLYLQTPRHTEKQYHAQVALPEPDHINAQRGLRRRLARVLELADGESRTLRQYLASSAEHPARILMLGAAPVMALSNSASKLRRRERRSSR